MFKRREQFSIWQLMKGVVIAALVANALLPFIRGADKVLENPGIFLAVMIVVFLVQSPILFLPNFIDWIFGNKPDKSDEQPPS